MIRFFGKMKKEYREFPFKSNRKIFIKTTRCNLCGKYIKEGEEFMACRYNNIKKICYWDKEKTEYYNFSNIYHLHHIDKEQIEKWKQENMIEKL